MLSERWRSRFFQPKVWARKRWFLKRYAEKLASRRVSGLSLLQLLKIFYVVLRSSSRKSVAEGLHGVAREPHKDQETTGFQSAHRLLIIERRYE